MLYLWFLCGLCFWVVLAGFAGWLVFFVVWLFGVFVPVGRVLSALV